jgi:hypothetical protein
VGIENGTGEFAQRMTLYTNPARKAAKAKYGKKIPKNPSR